MAYKILLFSDLHYTQIMPDAISRLQSIIAASERNRADCIICLGDTAWPEPEFQDIADLWNGISIPHYMVLGNHDLDRNTKREAVKFYCLPASYYSFDVKDLHFVALDTNYFKKEGNDTAVYDYACGNYYGQITDCIPQQQLDWLKTDLKKSKKPVILLSHAPLFDNGDPFFCCKNSRDIHNVILSHNQTAGWKQVFFSCNGHTHLDSLTEWDGIYHLEINSASNQWLGDAYEPLVPNTVFSAQQHENFPFLRYTAPFQDALYVLMTISLENHTVSIQGPQSVYVGKTPRERGHCGHIGGIPITACITQKHFSW